MLLSVAGLPGTSAMTLLLDEENTRIVGTCSPQVGSMDGPEFRKQGWYLSLKLKQFSRTLKFWD